MLHWHPLSLERLLPSDVRAAGCIRIFMVGGVFAEQARRWQNGGHQSGLCVLLGASRIRLAAAGVAALGVGAWYACPLLKSTAWSHLV